MADPNEFQRNFRRIIANVKEEQNRLQKHYHQLAENARNHFCEDRELRQFLYQVSKMKLDYYRSLNCDEPGDIHYMYHKVIENIISNEFKAIRSRWQQTFVLQAAKFIKLWFEPQNNPQKFSNQYFLGFLRRFIMQTMNVELEQKFLENLPNEWPYIQTAKLILLQIRFSKKIIDRFIDTNNVDLCTTSAHVATLDRMGFNLTIVSHRYMFQSVFYEITLPEPMKIAYEECVRFFKRENGVCGKHMIIFLHPRYGSVDIDYHLNDRTYHLKVTTLQALILCQFESEDVEQLTLKKMAFATKIRVDDLLVTLKFLMENSFFSDNGQMIAIPPLLVKEPNVSVFTYDDTFAMNKQFRSQRLNINLAKAFWCDLSKIHYGDDHGLTIMKSEPMDVLENDNNENPFTPSFFIRIINGDNVYNIPCKINNDINVEIESSQMQMIKEEDEKMEVSSIPLITDENNGIDIDSRMISMIVVDDNVLQSVLNLLHQRRWLPFKIILDHLIKNFPLFTSENLRQQLETLIEIRAIIPHRLNDTVFSLTEILR